MIYFITVLSLFLSFGISHAAICTIYGQNYTVTTTAACGVVKDTSNNSIDVIQGSDCSIGEIYFIDGKDKLCAGGGPDAIVVELNNTNMASIHTGDGLDDIFCDGDCRVDAASTTGKKYLECYAANMKARLGSGNDEFRVFSGCGVVNELLGNGGNDIVKYDDCDDLIIMNYNGGGGADKIWTYGHANCPISGGNVQLDETLTSVETTCDSGC